MILNDQLFLAVIYHNPADFPGMYVGRYHRIEAGNIVVDPAPFAVAPSLEAIHQAMAPGNDHQLALQAGEDPCILEVWV